MSRGRLNPLDSSCSSKCHADQRGRSLSAVAQHSDIKSLHYYLKVITCAKKAGVAQIVETGKPRTKVNLASSRHECDPILRLEVVGDDSIVLVGVQHDLFALGHVFVFVAYSPYLSLD